MIRRPPRSTRTDTLFPYPTLFRSEGDGVAYEILLTEHKLEQIRRAWNLPKPAYIYLRPEDLNGLRSEEHTSELQSLMRISYAVFCLKKKILKHINHLIYTPYKTRNAPATSPTTTDSITTIQQ